MSNPKSRRSLLLSAMGLIALVGMLAGTLFPGAIPTKAATGGYVVLAGSAAKWTRSAGVHAVGHHVASDQLTVGLLLRTSDAAGQQALLKQLYHAGNGYHQWLPTGAFSSRFGPSAAEVAAVTSYLTQSGLKLAASPDTSLVLATGTTSQVEAAFKTTIQDYSTPDGTYYGSTGDLSIPSALTSSVLTVVGTSNIKVANSYDMMDTAATPGATVPPYGGGPFGSGLTPSQIRGIYHVNPVYSKLGDKGEGTTISVFELSGYKGSDIVKYEHQYHLPNVNIQNIPVLGVATNDSGAGEVELDIELQIALAPNVKKLLVYESPNTELGALAQYLQMAKDNKADSISTSWGIVCEFFVNSQITLAENQIFLQMATQGQSIFAASGDAGAYGCSRVGFLPPAGQELQLGDPNNQPYITSVGGTSFQGPDNVTTFDPGKNSNPTYPGSTKELPWTDGCDPQNCVGGATGGGVSRIWAEPDYAANLTTGQPFPGVIGAYSQAGAYCGQQPGVLCRENPDVSLDADPSTGYSIYCTDPGDSFCATGEFGKPGWIRLGGTSCAAPLWAGIAALDITKHGHTRLGLFN